MPAVFNRQSRRQDEPHHYHHESNEAITEAVARYLHDAMIEKEQRQEESDPT